MYFLHQKGFTLVELILALAILSFGIIGVYGAFSSISALTHNVANQLTASYLNQEGIEIIRNLRDKNIIQASQVPGSPWDTGLLSCQAGCQATYKTGTSLQNPEDELVSYNPSNKLRIGPSGFYDYDAQGNPTRFARKITIVQENENTLKVTTEVFWDYNGKPFSSMAIGYLYNWY